MRFRLIFLSLAMLAIAHFAATPGLTRLFNVAASRLIQPTLHLEKLSVDLINSQAVVQNLKWDNWETGGAPLAEIQNCIVRWEFLPLLSRQCVLSNISITGAKCIVPVGSAPENSVSWQSIQSALPTDEKALNPAAQEILRKTGVSWSQISGMIKGMGKPASPKAPAKTASKKAPTPAQKKPSAYWLEKKGTTTIVHYRNTRPSWLAKNIYLADIHLRFLPAGENAQELPALTINRLNVRNASACILPLEKPMEFEASGQLENHGNSLIQAMGSLQKTAEGLNGKCDLLFQDLDLARLWPWINTGALPQEFRQFRITAGTMTLTCHASVQNNLWHLQNKLTLKNLKVVVNPEGGSSLIQGASPELVVKAINTLGETNLQFRNYKEWKEAFRENVMKGVRNLIRQSIQDSLANLIK